MGCFGYICKGCGTQIVGDCFTGGENCLMIHVRKGKELGKVDGHYDEYGRVIEQEGLPEEQKFRGDYDGINGHSEICDSEFSNDKTSGIVAWHLTCYNNATDEQKKDLIPSKNDTDQSCGEIRDKFK